MGPKKKDEKREDDEMVEESGSFVFEEVQGTYQGAIQRKGAEVKRNGSGAYQDTNVAYEGGWKDDQLHGTGKLRFLASNSAYDGGFYEGKFDGTGTFKWATGAVYVGQWRANRMHGDGVYTDCDGTVWHGKFYNGTGPGLRPKWAATV